MPIGGDRWMKIDKANICEFGTTIESLWMNPLRNFFIIIWLYYSILLHAVIGVFKFMVGH